MARLASYVDEKMRAAADSAPTGDMLRLAVLAALNVADELFRCRDVTARATANWPERAGELERLARSRPHGVESGSGFRVAWVQARRSRASALEPAP